MNEELLRAVQRYGEVHADAAGVAQTPVACLRTIHATVPSGLQYDVSRPLACLVLGGEKHVTMGMSAFTFGPDESLIITADVPTISQVTRASRTQPYCSLVLDLDLAMIADLSVEMKAVPIGDDRRVAVEPTDDEVAASALRLLRLVERPYALPVLQSQMVREMHYWLLAGRHGPAIRRLGFRDGHAHRIALAVAVLRTDFAQPLRVDDLAAAAGMSPSSFHHHFRNLTSLSPLQFQKHLRLVMARRLLLAEGASVSSAAFAVGYESVSHFTREYGRMFGLTPARDKVACVGTAQTVEPVAFAATKGVAEPRSFGIARGEERASMQASPRFEGPRRDGGALLPPSGRRARDQEGTLDLGVMARHANLPAQTAGGRHPSGALPTE